MCSVLGDLISVPVETRCLGHLKALKNVYNNFDTISQALDKDIYSYASLKPLFNSLQGCRSIYDAMIKVLSVIEKLLIKLQVDKTPTLNLVIPALV